MLGSILDMNLFYLEPLALVEIFKFIMISPPYWNLVQHNLAAN